MYKQERGSPNFSGSDYAVLVALGFGAGLVSAGVVAGVRALRDAVNKAKARKRAAA